MSIILIILKMLAYVLAASVLGLVVFVYLPLYLFQERLLFLRPHTNPQLLMSMQNKFEQIQSINLQTVDNVTLQGWLINPPTHGKSRPLLIYFGGNAEDVMTLIPTMSNFSAWTVLLMNYRGYGASEGQPSEAAFYQDALQLYDHFSQRQDIDPQRIVLMGRSLGAGVAVYLAQQRPAAGVILISPYQSLVQVAQTHYPFVPVKWLLKHRFESGSRAADITAPLLMIAAEQDEIIPFESGSRAADITAPLLMIAAEQDEIIPLSHSLDLAAQWAGAVEQVIIPQATHNNMSEAVGYWQAIRQFLMQF